MRHIFIFIFCSLLNAPPLAQSLDCHAKAKIPVEKRDYARSIVLMLDETTVFDETQRAHIIEQSSRLVVPGTELKVIAFSAYIGNRYSRTLLDSLLVAPLDRATRDSTRKDTLREFDRCASESFSGSKKRLQNIIQTYLATATSDIAKSDILGALKDVGDNIVPRLKSKQKYLVLISDMLENSNVSSFYLNNNDVRSIDPQKELANAEAKGMLTDFRQASVYVIGAGVLAPTSGKAQPYRPQVRTVLQDFWTQYFQKSNSKLVEFGAPLLLNPILLNP